MLINTKEWLTFFCYMIKDLTPYRQHVDQFDLTDEETLELVNAVLMLVDRVLDHHLGLNRLPAQKPMMSLAESNDKKREKTKSKSQSSSKAKQARQRKKAIKGE